MTTEAEGLPAAAIEDVAYLSRSPNRVAILTALADGPAPRRDLADETGVARTTLDRIVNEFEERGWTTRTPAGEYETTPAGTHLVQEFRPLVDAVAAIRNLGETVAWLPTEELDVGLEHFRDATVHRPPGDDPVETVAYFTDLVEEASTFRALTHLVPPEPLSRAMQEGVESGRLRTEGVVTQPYVAYLQQRPERSARVQAILEQGARLYRHEGPLPCNLWIADGTVMIKQSGEGAIPDAYGVPIVSENERVREWAVRLLERYRAEAVELEAEDFEAAAAEVEEG